MTGLGSCCFDEALECGREAVDEASAGACEAGLSAAAALDELGGFTDILAGVFALGYKVIGVH